MVANNFASALSLTLKHEGGWADDKDDSGGPTKYGVTLETYRQFRPGATVEALKALTLAEARGIYRKGYWQMVRADDLPAGVDLVVFDFAVNSGPARAARFLQMAVGAVPDGVIGPATLERVRLVKPASIIVEVCGQRMRFLRACKSWWKHKRGWTRRVVDMTATGLAWAGEHPDQIAKRVVEVSGRGASAPPPPKVVAVGVVAAAGAGGAVVMHEDPGSALWLVALLAAVVVSGMAGLAWWYWVRIKEFWRMWWGGLP